MIDLSSVSCAWYVRDVWPLIRSGIARLEMPSTARHDAVVTLDGLMPRPSGYLSWNTRTGRPVMTDADTTTIERIEAHSRWIAQTVADTTVRDWPALVSDDFNIHDDPRFLPWLAGVDLAKQTGLPLWADDLGLRTLARDAGVSTFSTVALMAVLEEDGRLSMIQRQTAMLVLRDEYCVDLELDAEWLRRSAAASDWRGGVAAMSFSRPATWTESEAAFGIWTEIVQAAADFDPALIAGWVYSAATAFCRSLPRDRTSAVVAPLIVRGIVAGRFQRSVFATCLEAGREASREHNAADPLGSTLDLLFEILTENAGTAGAAEILSTCAAGLEADDRVALRRVLFGVDKDD